MMRDFKDRVPGYGGADDRYADRMVAVASWALLAVIVGGGVAGLFRWVVQ